ncbi:MAG: SAM-dependent methyltransferase [Bacteroides sp. SM23_62_1]|nr:MAG: SAM-dependent methyltransferase [Bacteroides sp. SM23_62_1]
MHKNIQFRITKDGAHTLYIPEMDECYHSMHGAINESVHVFLQAGFSYHTLTSVKILEIGFGTGLNAILTMIRAEEERRPVIYHSIDIYPLPMDIIAGLNYPELLSGIYKKIFIQMHEASWDKEHEITYFFRLKKILADIQDYEIQDHYDVVYFDAFAPDKQPELWLEGIFTKIFHAMAPGGILTTYSSKGEIQRRLTRSGFIVDKIPGPPGKREMLRCIKKN